MYLLDTNALIILLYNQVTDAELTRATAEIMHTERKLYVSIVSLWEMTMKMQVRKLNLGKSICEVEKECSRQGIEIIPISGEHLDRMLTLPLMQDHKDPFDRYIMATALSEDMTLISTDSKVRRKEYGVKVVW